MAIIALVKVQTLQKDLAQLRGDFIQYMSSGEPVAQAAKRRAAQASGPPRQSRAVNPNPQPAARPKPITPPPQERPRTKPPQGETVKGETVKAAPIKPKAAPKPRASLEETIGAQWSVWVGAIALAIGAVFLIRFSIETGMFTPALRLGLAALLGLIALAGGEWLRRRDDLWSGVDIDKASRASSPETSVEKAYIQKAYIPGVLTGIGVFTWLGVIYAAHAIYGFIGPAPTFLLLGLTSLMGLAFGLLHGPKMAALGLLAALMTPLLVDTSAPNFPALYGYLGLIGGAALTLAQTRRWSGIGSLTLFGLLLWTLLSQNALKAPSTCIMWIIFAALSYGASLWTVMREETGGLLDGGKWPSLSLVKFDRRVSAVWTAGLAFITIVIYALFNGGDLTAAACLSLAGLFAAAGIWQRRFNLHILIGGALAGGLAVWGALGQSAAVITAGLTGLALWGLCLRESRLSPLPLNRPHLPALYWTVISAAAPIFIWTLLAIEKGGRSLTKTPWFDLNALGYVEGAVYVAIAMILGASAEYLWRRDKGDRPKSFVMSLSAMNIYVAAGGAAIALGLLTTLNIDIKFYAALTMAIMGGALYYIRPVWALRPLIAGALCLAAALAVLHHIQGGDVGTRRLINSLWIFLALPALLSFGLEKLLSLKDDDLWSEGLKALALSLAALFVIMQIHHIMNNGRVLATSFSLEEAALYVLTGLCFTWGGAWMDRGAARPIGSRPSHQQILPFLSMGLTIVTLIGFSGSVILAMNPLLNANISIKGIGVLNSLVIAYLLPALLLGAIALVSRRSRPKAYVRGLAGLGLLSFMIYVTASVRAAFSGKMISLFAEAPQGTELYAISAAWLLIGISLLGAGLKTRRQDLRIVSGAIIIVTVLKAFLIDMAGLEGVLRAMSFVSLGVILIVIGRVYQKLIFNPETSSIPPVEQP